MKRAPRSRPARLAPWLAVAVLAALAGAGAGTAAWTVVSELPDVRQLEFSHPALATRFLDRQGRLLAELAIERRTPVALADVSPLLVDALLAAEDADFRRHPGVDAAGILRAAWSNLRQLRVSQGGSTITQQLAKLLFLTPERTYRRKLREALIAIEIETTYTKDRILEIYLNQIYLGAGAYGVEAAARTYFGVSAGTVDLAQAALLAGLARAPSLDDPFKNPERALARRAHVLRRMAEEGRISRDEAERAAAGPLELAPPAPAAAAPHFVESIRIELEDRLGSQRLLAGGLTVWTTLDLDAQKAAEQAVARGVAELAERQPELPPPEAALLAIEHENGRILALAGGTDFERRRFNLATQAKRRPGSLFKPVVYLAALRAGLTQATILEDAPTRFGSWSPANYDRRFRGPVTLREALEDSINTVAVKLLSRTGIPALRAEADRLGLELPRPGDLTLALGTHTVTLQAAVEAMAAIAAGGLAWPAYGVERIETPDGSLLPVELPAPREAVPPDLAFVLADMLHGVVESGTARRAAALGGHLAGKTGTTDDYVDAWFVGFDRRRTAGAWIGRDPESSLGRGETGGRAALPIWTAFMEVVSSPADRRPSPPPDGVEQARVCRASGELAGPDCRATFSGWFLTGTAPRTPCRRHAPAP